MRQWFAPIAGGLAAATLGFWLVLNWVPGFLMDKALGRLTSFGPGYNQVFHGPITDETSRRVVRPSPDILYSVCAYDLSEGDVEISVPWPTDESYASVSFYDANTNNYDVLSDREISGEPNTQIRLMRSLATPVTQPGDVSARLTFSPTTTGLALYRRVLMGDTPIEQVEHERRAFSCTINLSD
jgi:uncharacterized membrane protein